VSNKRFYVEVDLENDEVTIYKVVVGEGGKQAIIPAASPLYHEQDEAGNKYFFLNQQNEIIKRDADGKLHHVYVLTGGYLEDEEITREEAEDLIAHAIEEWYFTPEPPI